MGKRVREHTGPVGGFSFFISLFFLSLLTMTQIAVVLSLLGRGTLPRFGAFLSSSAVGVLIAGFLVEGHLSVFLHELKHSVASGLVGNRAKSMKVRKNSGEFRYEYTEETARYNAFIALAPYCLPLFTFLLTSISYAVFGAEPGIRHIVCAGLGFGVDTILNIRDISPHQSDLFRIRGGYAVGLCYITVANLWYTTLLLAWVLQGHGGLVAVVKGWIALGYLIVAPGQRPAMW